MVAWFRRERVQQRVAVIGAGIAGLAAAHYLQQRRDIQVHLYEAQEEVGGRLYSHRTEWALIDHGAQYFTCRSPSFRAVVQKALAADELARWDFQPYQFDEGMLRPSPDGETRYVGVKGMRGFAEYLAQGLNLQRRVPIRRIIERGSKIDLGCLDGQLDSGFDGVILAMPPTACVKLLGDDSSLSQTLCNYELSPAWSIALGFQPGAFPPVFQEFGGVFVRSPELSWISHNSQKPGRRKADSLDTWVLQFRPYWSRKNAQLPERQLQILAVSLLSRVLQRHLPAPVAYNLHYWEEARGLTESVAPGPIPHARLPLICCGDWSEGGRVEGAFLAGEQAARRLENRLTTERRSA